MVPRGGGGGGRGEQESNEEEPLPWPMLGALLFVYVNNQWSRSLIPRAWNNWFWGAPSGAGP